MDIKLSRYTTPNIYNYKTVIQFPEEHSSPYIWRDFSNNGTSCFNFDPNKEFFELNNIYAEDSPAITNYDISQNPYILLRCIRQQYDFSLNDYVIKLANSTSIENLLGGYILSRYITEINRGIFYANKSSISLNQNDLNLPSDIINQPDISDNKIPTIYNDISWNTYCYQDPDNLKIKFQFDITRVYTADKYIIDVSNTILQKILDIDAKNSDISSNNSRFDCFFPPLANGYYVPFNIPVVKFLLKNEYTGSPINYIRYDIFMDKDGNRSSVVRFYKTATELIDAINKAFDQFIFYYYRNYNYTQDISTNPVQGTFLTPVQFIPSSNIYKTTIDISINVPITSEDYQVVFYDASGTYYDMSGYFFNHSPWSPNGTWATNLKMIDHSYNLMDDLSLNHTTITGNSYVLPDEIILNDSNNTIKFEPIPTANGLYGLYQAQGDNIITIDMSTNYPYRRQELINDLNRQLRQNPLTVGSYFFIENNRCRLRLNINKIYTANDYNLVFYDTINFVKCYVGATSVRNVSWDSTLGWILGFRLQTTYPLSTYYTITSLPSGISVLTGDSTVVLNLYNYFMIILDDFNQNHLNDGLVTIKKKDYSIFQPSYTKRSPFICNNPDSSSNQISITNNTIIQDFQGNNSQSNMTQNQIYASTQLINANKTNNTLLQTSPGPYIKDIFGLIPLKTGSMSPGDSYIEFGGTLQAQERIYFGPVNIHRMHIQLINDHGDVVNLNGQNWSFSLLCEQLYQNQAV